MLVRVLGGVSLTANDDTEVALPGGRQPALLAALAARSGEVVAVDRLVDLLWGEAPPDNPAAALHSAVFKLRANLSRVSGRGVLVTRDPGYLLDLHPGELDSEVFESLVQAARDLPPAEAAETLARALRLWRGRAYDGFGDTDLARIEALRLEEMRRVAVERCGTALLASGRAAEAVTLLQPFVVEHPLREAARIILMQALHAEGRTAEALEQYQVHRRELADELGLEPSSALTEAQLAVLRRTSPIVPGDATSTEPSDRGGLTGMRVRYLRAEAGHVVAHGVAGTGPNVVVLLGWISSLDVIASGRDPRSSLLERLTDELSLTLYDRAGTGLSPGPVLDYGLEASVAELADVVRAVGPPVALMAMSAAGPIALTLAHRHPEWVSSLVLFGTFADGPATFDDESLREQVVAIARSHWGVGSKMLADFYRPGISDAAAWHLAKVFRDSASPEVAASYLEHVYPLDVSPLLPEIGAPALVLHYRSDRLIRFRGGQQLATGLPHATLLALDGKVHLPDASDLDTIEQAIVEHVRRHA
jgi:DNA-binding SARP family transcriptional activator/pimeloyl-ACP methyl ester carboxylesterase